MLKMIEATKDDIDQLDELYKACTSHLFKKGLKQWDQNYPNINIYIDAVNNRYQYIFREEFKLIGSCILDEKQAETWHLVNWKYNNVKILILHALAINPSLQGQGYGQKVLNMCQIYGLDRGYHYMRLDVFSKNQSAIHLYEKNGFIKAGEVYFDFKPEGHQKYLCYEKKLV